MSYQDSLTSLPGDLIEEIDHEEARSGDILYFNTTPDIFSHSCVRIDEDLCFSMNGVNDSFSIYNLTDVIAEYARAGTEMRYFRKKREWTVPEEFSRAFGLKGEADSVQALYREIGASQPSERETWLAAADSVKS